MGAVTKAVPKMSYSPTLIPKDNDSHLPSNEEIAYCAYLIWEKEGKPAGHEREHWLQAETQLLACRAHEKWTREPAEHAEERC